MDATMQILQRRFAMHILMRLYANPGCLIQDAIEMDVGSYRTRYKTLKALINCGLVNVVQSDDNHKNKPLYLSDTGCRIAEHLNEIYKLLPYRECEPWDYR